MKIQQTYLVHLRTNYWINFLKLNAISKTSLLSVHSSVEAIKFFDVMAFPCFSHLGVL